MKVLVACEYSGRVRDEFIKRGHDAMSCDLLPTESKGPHHQGDVRDILGNGFDLLIAHPPCTHLASSGARHFKGKEQLQKDAIRFVFILWNAPIKKIAIENPVGIFSQFIKPDQIIEPYQFGHYESKKTCLWLRNLPFLVPTKIVPSAGSMIYWEGAGKDQAKKRSLTYIGIARAMAEQWG